LKKITFLLLLLFGQTFALERESTLKFYHHVLDALFNKDIVSIYVDDDIYKNVFSYSDKIKTVVKMEKADMVLITNDAVLQKALLLRKKPLLFATQYDYLSKSQDIVGAFYWKKGRAQLLFVKDRLLDKGMTLSDEYQKYLLDTL